MKYKILIRTKPQILDPQGEVIEKNLNSLGFKDVSNIRQGKIIELNLDDKIDHPESYIEEMCQKLLVNQKKTRY